jgi:phosphoribosylformylglycinamidine synthase
MPIVSGNVSLYNETEGRAILPTPTIGGVGLLASLDELIRVAPRPGDRLFMLGETQGHLGQSALLADVFGREEGDAPEVDLEVERANGLFLRAAKAAGLVTAAHDLSCGGLALAATEMALAAGVGVEIVSDGDVEQIGWFFGEDQARYLVACAPERGGDLIALAAEARAPLRPVGRVHGAAVRLGAASVPLAELAAAHAECLSKLLD